NCASFIRFEYSEAEINDVFYNLVTPSTGLRLKNRTVQNIARPYWPSEHQPRMKAKCLFRPESVRPPQCISRYQVILSLRLKRYPTKANIGDQQLGKREVVILSSFKTVMVSDKVTKKK